MREGECLGPLLWSMLIGLLLVSLAIGDMMNDKRYQDVTVKEFKGVLGWYDYKGSRMPERPASMAYFRSLSMLRVASWQS